MRNGFPLVRSAAALLLGLLPAVIGPGCTESAPPDTSTETLYPYGTRRDELVRRYGSGGLIYIRDTPSDEFAAALTKQLIREGRPRPVAYETFLRRRGTSTDNPNPRDFDLDYVFYTSEMRVIYSARRTTAPSDAPPVP